MVSPRLISHALSNTRPASSASAVVARIDNTRRCSFASSSSLVKRCKRLSRSPDGICVTISVQPPNCVEPSRNFRANHSLTHCGSDSRSSSSAHFVGPALLAPNGFLSSPSSSFFIRSAICVTPSFCRKRKVLKRPKGSLFSAYFASEMSIARWRRDGGISSGSSERTAVTKSPSLNGLRRFSTFSMKPYQLS